MSFGKYLGADDHVSKQYYKQNIAFRTIVISNVDTGHNIAHAYYAYERFHSAVQ